jgi:hypothetical protein
MLSRLKPTLVLASHEHPIRWVNEKAQQVNVKPVVEITEGRFAYDSSRTRPDQRVIPESNEGSQILERLVPALILAGQEHPIGRLKEMVQQVKVEPVIESTESIHCGSSTFLLASPFRQSHGDHCPKNY